MAVDSPPLVHRMDIDEPFELEEVEVPAWGRQLPPEGMDICPPSPISAPASGGRRVIIPVSRLRRLVPSACSAPPSAPPPALPSPLVGSSPSLPSLPVAASTPVSSMSPSFVPLGRSLSRSRAGTARRSRSPSRSRPGVAHRSCRHRSSRAAPYTLGKPKGRHRLTHITNFSRPPLVRSSRGRTDFPSDIPVPPPTLPSPLVGSSPVLPSLPVAASTPVSSTSPSFVPLGRSLSRSRAGTARRSRSPSRSRPGVAHRSCRHRSSRAAPYTLGKPMSPIQLTHIPNFSRPPLVRSSRGRTDFPSDVPVPPPAPLPSSPELSAVSAAGRQRSPVAPLSRDSTPPLPSREGTMSPLEFEAQLSPVNGSLAVPVDAVEDGVDLVQSLRDLQGLGEGTSQPAPQEAGSEEENLQPLLAVLEDFVLFDEPPSSGSEVVAMLSDLCRPCSGGIFWPPYLVSLEGSHWLSKATMRRVVDWLVLDGFGSLAKRVLSGSGFTGLLVLAMAGAFGCLGLDV
ncbi:hypothetical protein BGW37DRAFT_519788 [Umbelopsis sp. PMI_123]|nr:hypothetical protein BGW37DRAFT_519788 [Umbelopsis sp. PMI_123]